MLGPGQQFKMIRVGGGRNVTGPKLQLTASASALTSAYIVYSIQLVANV